ncbi:anti-anti-sigma factor [Couchioplanes caeruleus]|uniref:STAS domain-containing protein n=3 Tax=Couchioplanes caeruleus TaxID=56438 RepID=A0A1K0FEW4_9ACTN|nr:hypothetical protein BG844_26705 [Couchioplanes caeruleus subsp. caeruleus]ROP28393.1 anti-anti-sigma factor [Couchioplanes caeruleus]
MVRAQSGRVPEIVVEVTGALAGSTVEAWSHTFTRASDSRPARLIIDLAACPSIDTAAIVILLRVHRQMKRSGGRLLLRRPGPAVLRLFYVARVDQVLEVEGSGRPQ